MQIILSCLCIKQIIFLVFLPIQRASHASVICDLPILSRVFKVMSSNLIDTELILVLFFMKSMSTTTLSSYFFFLVSTICKYAP